MKALIISACFGALVFSGTAVGTVFPDIKGETLDNKTVSIPVDTKGKSTLVCMSYSADAEKDLRTWYEPTYDKFIAQTEMFSYDINLYFIPMFTGVNAVAAGPAKKQMQKDVQADLQPHVMFYSGEIQTYKEKLKMDDPKLPYIFVLDKDGKIIYETTGAYSEEKMDEIDEHLE
jgi:hypothetical protein